MKTHSVFQFKITLQDVAQPIWRQIQINDQCTFWDLHVAIQDAMGWTDSHLHEFTVVNPTTSKKEHIGIPDDEGFATPYPLLACWDVKVKEYVLAKSNKKFSYLYDFGDSWVHVIEFEGEYEEQSGKYPKCLAGERACPPEDVGGAPGFENFLSIIKNAKRKERQGLLEWVGGKYDPEKFDYKKVKFDDPNMRWRNVFAAQEEF